MKFFIVALLLSGCAMQDREPLTMEQRIEMSQMRSYVLPIPQAPHYQQSPIYTCVPNYGSGPTTYSCQQ